MLYRIRLDLAFANFDDMNDIYDKALDKFFKALTINPGTNIEEKGFISTEDCYHDEDPTKPCQPIAEHTTS